MDLKIWTVTNENCILAAKNPSPVQKSVYSFKGIAHLTTAHPSPPGLGIPTSNPPLRGNFPVLTLWLHPDPRDSGAPLDLHPFHWDSVHGFQLGHGSLPWAGCPGAQSCHLYPQVRDTGHCCGSAPHWETPPGGHCCSCTALGHPGLFWSCSLLPPASFCSAGCADPPSAGIPAARWWRWCCCWSPSRWGRPRGYPPRHRCPLARLSPAGSCCSCSWRADCPAPASWPAPAASAPRGPRPRGAPCPGPWPSAPGRLCPGPAPERGPAGSAGHSQAPPSSRTPRPSARHGKHSKEPRHF